MVSIVVKQSVELVPEETNKLLGWATGLESSTNSYFEQTQALARKLGAHYRDDGLTEVGFWVPGLIRDALHEREIYLEVFTPLEPIDWRSQEQRIRFRRDRLHLEQQGEFIWGVVSGMTPGTKDQAGCFYWLRYIDRAENVRTVRDLMPYSLPYGIFAPAELYDMASLQRNRADLDYFKAPEMKIKGQTYRVEAPCNILQMHVGTASAEGTIEGLTRIYKTIGEKIVNKEPLTTEENYYVGYDAIQLLPTEPTIEFRDEYTPESEFFSFVVEDDDGETIEIELTKPHTQDWGYDVPILGSSTTNPSLLGSLRPDEVVEFITTLHNFPAHPIKLIYDLVYGHADNQSELLISRQFLKGPNMYGQDLNHQLPMVRAILLEMQRRKINDGVDGIRIDGGQDFRFFNPLSGKVEQDDAYLLAMSNVPQEITEHKRLLFTIFEDGRPWPEEGWEEKSRYRELIELKPESYQWGPLIFAHNTPSLHGFWDKKWSRVLEVMTIGDRWITGCANHDTVRRGNQIDLKQSINRALGANLAEILHQAYDNPAITTWVYGFSPGLPMDFINATMHAPWMFFRNTDEQYGVKVVSEEIGFLHWQITPQLYRQAHIFPRLKAQGFKQLKQLQEFGKALQLAMEEQDYNLSDVVEVLRSCAEKPNFTKDVAPLKELMRGSMVRFLKKLDIDRLKNFAVIFMEECYKACNVTHYKNKLDSERAEFNLSLRDFRRNHHWIAENMQEGDIFDRIKQDKSIFYGVRYSPDKSEGIALVSHMEGEETTIDVFDLLKLEPAQWKLAIATPNLVTDDLTKLTIKQSQAILLIKS